MRLKTLYFFVQYTIISWAFFWLSSVIVQPCFADPPRDPPALTAEEEQNNIKHIEMLKRGQFDQLDLEMRKLQSDFEEGRISDIQLEHLFRAFFDADEELEPLYIEWTKKHPDSYPAHEATGIYYRKMGYAARGRKYANQTTSQQFDGLDRNLKLAIKSHERSIGLTKKPLLTYYNLVSIFKLQGDCEAARKWFEQSIKTSPKNFIVRYKHMLNLEGRWCGSLEKMQEFRSQAEQDGIPDELLKHFDDLINDEIGWLKKHGKS